MNPRKTLAAALRASVPPPQSAASPCPRWPDADRPCIPTALCCDMDPRPEARGAGSPPIPGSKSYLFYLSGLGWGQIHGLVSPLITHRANFNTRGRKILIWQNLACYKSSKNPAKFLSISPRILVLFGASKKFNLKTRNKSQRIWIMQASLPVARTFLSDRLLSTAGPGPHFLPVDSSLLAHWPFAPLLAVPAPWPAPEAPPWQWRTNRKGAIPDAVQVLIYLRGGWVSGLAQLFVVACSYFSFSRTPNSLSYENRNIPLWLN